MSIFHTPFRRIRPKSVVMIGPSIPEHLLKAKREREEKETEEKQETEAPPSESPPNDREADDDDDADAFAPALPPDLLEARQKQKQTHEPQPKRRAGAVGPTLPPGLQRSYLEENADDDDDVVGPRLPSNYDPEQESKQSAIAAIEARAQQSREAMDEAARDAKSKKVERDEWMLLPPEIDYLRNGTCLCVASEPSLIRVSFFL